MACVLVPCAQAAAVLMAARQGAVLVGAAAEDDAHACAGVRVGVRLFTERLGRRGGGCDAWGYRSPFDVRWRRAYLPQGREIVRGWMGGRDARCVRDAVYRTRCVLSSPCKVSTCARNGSRTARDTIVPYTGWLYG
eukprot:5596552-Pleurochrysis_carterae.AAC.1